MQTAFLRYTLSVILGVVIAVGALAGIQALQPSWAHAQGTDETPSGQLTTSDFFGGGDSFREQSGLGEADLKQTVANLIRVALGFLGIIAVVIVLFGGFKWMTASGNDEKVAEAKRLLISGVIGLAIIISAWAITTFVISSLLAASQ